MIGMAKTGIAGLATVAVPFMAGAFGAKTFGASRRAVAGGDYSAVNHNVGPRGGRVLVDETVSAINEMW